MPASDAPRLLVRQRAVQHVQAKYEGKSFLLGRRDCVTMAADLLRKLGRKLPKVPPYKGEIGAARALKGQGANDLRDLVDLVGLQRIAPAAALIGDLLFLPSDDETGIGALVIAIGNGAGIGFHGAHKGMVAMRDLAAQAAWRTLP